LPFIDEGNQKENRREEMKTPSNRILTVIWSLEARVWNLNRSFNRDKP